MESTALDLLSAGDHRLEFGPWACHGTVAMAAALAHSRLKSSVFFEIDHQLG